MNGQPKIVKREIGGKIEPRKLFERHNDFAPENDQSGDQIKLLEDVHKSHITCNGDYFPFTLIAEGIGNVFAQLNTIAGVSVPRDPEKLGSHVGLLKALIDITIAIYKCSTMPQAIGGKVRALGIRPDGTYQTEWP